MVIIKLPFFLKKKYKKTNFDKTETNEVFIHQRKIKRRQFSGNQIFPFHILKNAEYKENIDHIQKRDHRDQGHQHKKTVTDRAAVKTDPCQRKSPQYEKNDPVTG